MALLTIANLSMSIGQRVLLDGANLMIDSGQCVGLVGPNGCGKSCLLRAVAGSSPASITGGQIQRQRGSTVGLLTQDSDLDPHLTLRQEAEKSFADWHEMRQQLDTISQEMAGAEGKALAKLLKKYERIERDMQTRGGFVIDHRIDATLHGLGLDEHLFDVKVGKLSGGQQAKLALAKLLLMEPDLLLLDEATNHLDIDGRKWLEQFLTEYRGAVIVVSHDRWLLDRVVSQIYEFEASVLVEFPGNYSRFRQLRAQRHLTQQRLFAKQQQKINQQQQFIERYRSGQRSKEARGRERRLERFMRDEAMDAPTVSDAIHIALGPRTRSGDIVLRVDRIGKSYGDKTLFTEFTMTIQRGDRIGIIGPNGSGKSTLAQCLGEARHPDQGTVRLGANVDVGMYWQTPTDLDPDQTVIQYLQRHVPGGHEQTARNLAGAFLFSGSDQSKLLGSLSGGERSRTILAGMLIQGKNLLILDEPTNHLDILSVEQLEDALVRFSGSDGQDKSVPKGTLILVSHDRMLLDALTDQLLIFDGQGSVRHFLGRYSEYAAERECTRSDARPEQSNKRRIPRSKTRGAETPEARNTSNALSQASLEAEIESTETELAEIDKQLADPRVYQDGPKMKTLQGQRRRLILTLEPLESEWASRAGG